MRARNRLTLRELLERVAGEHEAGSRAHGSVDAGTRDALIRRMSALARVATPGARGLQGEDVERLARSVLERLQRSAVLRGVLDAENLTVRVLGMLADELNCGDQPSLLLTLEHIGEQVDRRRQGSAAASEDDATWRRLTQLLQSMASRSRSTRRPDTDDIVQRVLLKLQDSEIVRRILLSNDPGEYVRRMVVNEQASTARQQRNEEVRLKAFREEHARTEGDWIEEWLEQELPSYLNQLSEEDRRLLALRFWGGLSVREVARLLGMHHSTAMSRYFRLFHHLRGLLETGRRSTPEENP